jgi:serine/threonine protein kinase
MASKRQTPGVVISGPTVSPQIGIGLIRRLVDAARTLQSNALAQSDVHAWNDEARDYLTQALGAASPTVNSVLHTGGDVGIWNGMSPEEYQAELKGQLENKIKLLNSAIRRLETSIAIAGAPTGADISVSRSAAHASNQSRGGPSEFETATEQYTRGKILGEGGAGRVFRAKDSSGRDFAIKCLHPRQATKDRRRRFRNELAFLRSNTHKNILTVIDDGLVDWEGSRTPFYVMPLYPATLRTVMQNGIPPDQVLQLFSRILDGVEAAHLSRVIHRDLKPENVLVDESNICVVADFGIAHFEEEELVTAVETKANDRLANFLYAAPEQRVRGGTVTERADLFALGLILNEMFTGAVIQGTGFQRIASVHPSSSYLDEIVDRLVQNNPVARYASIDEVKKDLIAARNLFVSRQALDAQARQVVRPSAPGEVEPVTLMAADWEGGVLKLELNRAPEIGWVQRFKQPREGYSSLIGAEPARFTFSNKNAYVNIDGRSAQTIINHFKNYLQMATRGYQQDINAAAAQREREERAGLEAQRKAAEERAKVLSALKI